MQLEEATAGLEAASRLSEQLDQREEAISALKEEGDYLPLYCHFQGVVMHMGARFACRHFNPSSRFYFVNQLEFSLIAKNFK